MHKKVISLVAVLVLVLGFAAVSSAKSEIIYGGYVSVTSSAPVMVLADTGIWVFNPNVAAITCKVTHLIDKHGNILLTNANLLDGNQPITSIPSGGHGWVTLGYLLTLLPQPGPEVGTYKLLYRITCSGPRPAVVEVKEVIYRAEQEISPALPNPIFNPTIIDTWAETALGGPTGTGKF